MGVTLAPHSGPWRVRIYSVLVEKDWGQWADSVSAKLEHRSDRGHWWQRLSGHELTSLTSGYRPRLSRRICCAGVHQCLVMFVRTSTSESVLQRSYVFRVAAGTIVMPISVAMVITLPPCWSRPILMPETPALGNYCTACGERVSADRLADTVPVGSDTNHACFCCHMFVWQAASFSWENSWMAGC